jgi:hypothetical protein
MTRNGCSSEPGHVFPGAESESANRLQAYFDAAIVAAEDAALETDTPVLQGRNE